MKRLSAAKFVSSPMLTKAKQNSQPRMDLETLVDANTMLSSEPLLAKTENTSEAAGKSSDQDINQKIRYTIIWFLPSVMRVSGCYA